MGDNGKGGQLGQAGVFFLIRSLGHGGAERQLIELVKRMDQSRFRVTVATFYSGGALRRELDAISGIRVVSLDKRGRWDVFGFLWRLARAISEAKPRVVHGYMGIANELSLLFGPLFRARVVWGLRVSEMEENHQEWISTLSFRIGAALSRFASLIIANSHAGWRHHHAKGYAADKMMVISNGIDTARFYPDLEARKRKRREWGLEPEQILVGLVGRINPQKDHPTFLRAAALLHSRHPETRFVCVGDGPADYRAELERLACELGLEESVLWIRASNDMRGVYNAFDIAGSSSAYGEGFANAVGEAMSCGVPVVVTDVGDSALIVGHPELVVPKRKPEVLAHAWEQMLAMDPAEREALGKAGRQRIIEHFSLERLSQRTMAALEAIK